MATLVDYKVVSESMDADGNVVHQIIRFYEGDVSTLDEEVRGELQSVTRYRRTAMISEVEYYYE